MVKKVPRIDQPLEQRLSRAAEEVRAALALIVERVPIQAKKPAEFERVLKLDRSLSSRLLRALRLGDPLAALRRMPGPYGLRLFLKSVVRCRIDPELLDRTERAIGELEDLVTREIGDWKALDAALCGWLPDVREQFEIAQRQQAFKAMSSIRGIMAETELSVTLMHPSTERPGWVDRACITGLVRMRRLRPGAPMGLMHGHSIAPPPGVQRLSLDGTPIGRDYEPGLLHEFSTQPTPQFEVLEQGNIVHYLLKGDGVGVDSMVDLLFADKTIGRYPATKDVSPQPASPGAAIDVPVKVLIVDVLVHRDVWPGVEPELRMYDTAVRGTANPLDASRDIDRRDVLEGVLKLGDDVSRFRTKEVARYPEMVEHVCGRLGWDIGAFRAYRCRIEYPVYGYHVAMVFEPPAA